MKRILAFSIAFLVGFSFSSAEAAQKKKKKDPTREVVKETPKEPAPEVKSGPTKEELEAQQRRAEEQQRVEAAKKKLELEARKQSKITPGTASRWSNKGAMQPIIAEVPITTELPARAVPLAPGQETPGQSLVGSEELLQFRLYFSAHHQETRGQDFVFLPDISNANGVSAVKRAPYDNDIDLFRGRATISYEHVAGSDVSLRLDLEYRGRASGARRTDHRINELYVNYGLADFRRDDPMNFGISIGRVAVREAGYAQTDGALLRLKFSDEFKLGVFGGVTGNPYGYNWAARETQEFSADWIRAGAFGAYREGRFFANVAGVATLNRLAGERLPGAAPNTPSASGLDRVYLFLDSAYLVTEEINIFVTGWLDFVGGDLLQNVEAVFAWSPTNQLDLRFGGGRFSTLIYDVSTAYSFEIDPAVNKAKNNNGIDVVIVDELGRPIVPFDSVLGKVTYTTARARAGYRVIPSVEVFASTELMLRDASATQQATQAAAGAQLEFASLRLLPSAGARFRDPDILDASLSFTYIADDQSNANAMVRGALGREFFGFYAQADARRYLGDIDGTDGGVELSYTFPREWTPGRFMLRTMLRYYQENVRLARPTSLTDNTVTRADNDPYVSPELFYIPHQETYLGFASAEWRF